MKVCYNNLGEESFHFEFMEVDQMFFKFYELVSESDQWKLLITSHWVTSGYWIEKNPNIDEHVLAVYNDLGEVQEFEKRYRTARASTNALSLGCVVI